MDSNNKESPVPAPPKIRYSIHLGDVEIGFVSKSQRSRFLKYRTYLDGRGQRHLIHGLQSMNSGVSRSRGCYYYNHCRLPKSIGEYNYNKRKEE